MAEARINCDLSEAMSAEPAKGEPEPGVAGDEEYERLRLALQLAVPGELLVVQVDSGQERARLPERLAQDGLQRPWIYVDLAEERVLVGTKLEPLPVLRALGGLPQMLRALLQAPGAAPPEVVFLDGLERWLNADAEPEPGDALEQLSLSREALAALPAVVVFLLPGDLVQLLRERALNLWTWRAYDFALATDGAQVKRPEPTLQVWLKSPRGDSREARARRVHVYRNLLAAQEERGRLLRFRCEYCGCEVRYAISVEPIFRHLAVQCPRVPEERAWRIAGRLSTIERDHDAQQATLAHLFKHPEDFGRTIYVVLDPSIGKPLSVTTVTTTKENASWLEWTKVKEK